MDRHAQVVREGARGAARRGAGLGALLLALASGCVSSGQLTGELGGSPVPVNQVVAIWSNQVMAGVDPAHNGAPMHGLAGRVYLYGPDLKDNVIADGKLVVELYATLPEHPEEPPACLQSWEIKKEILNGACLRNDFIGPGYTLNLPWPTYRPDIAQVQVHLRYEPAKGLPVYAQNTVTFNSAAAVNPAVARRTETGDRQPVPTAAPPAPVQPVGATEPPAQTFQTPQPLPGAAQRR